MKKVILTDILLLEIKNKKARKKLINLLELIQVKKVIRQIMTLVEYKLLIVGLKTDN